MSARSSYKHDSNKGFGRSQQKFVPRNDNSSNEANRDRKFVPKTENSSNEANPSLSFTRSLRESSSKIGGDVSNSASRRVKLGENANWVSGKEGGSFVNYLPQDEAVAVGLGVEHGGLDAVESQRVVDLLNRELCRLLKMGPRDFWKEVANDGTLHEFLDSYLQFRSRWYDFPHHGSKETVAGIIVGEFELNRRVLMILYRISSNKDPGARGHDTLSAKEHGAFLLEKKLLDLPKLLDICGIYGHDNEDLARVLVNNAMKAQPTLLENLTGIVSHFLSIAHTMHKRCNSSLEVLLSSAGHEGSGHSQLHLDFLEVLDFINDAIVSLDAFVDVYIPAAIYFSYPVELSYGSEELLNTLAKLHDSLLPSLLRGFSLISASTTDGRHNCSTLPDVSLILKMLSMRIVKFGWKLLDFCYLSDDPSEDLNPPLTATKIFPAKVEDPVIRGDILVQTFREISGGASSHSPDNQKSATFLQNVEKEYKILSRLQNLRTNGWIFMDDEQFQYLALIATPVSSKAIEKVPVAPTNSLNRVQMDEDTAMIESNISQIKDIFPDYGKGFLSACLVVYNHNSEEVIQRILEGTLHEDLLSLDTSLEQVPPLPPKSLSLNKNDKGKAALVEPVSLSKNGKGKGTLVEKSMTTSTSNMETSVGDMAIGGSSSSSSSSYGRYMRKSKDDKPDFEILNMKGAKDSVRSALLASQYEYDDEYDDSFDDLGLSLVESGFEETESMGDRISSLPEKSTLMDSESSAKQRWWEQKKPQFYVKDGKNYSYKVSGSIAASNAQVAAVINHTQKGIIHGLGRGGNIPHGSAKLPMSFYEQENQPSETPEAGVRADTNSKQDNQVSSLPETGPRGNSNSSNSRGRGRGRGAGNHYRKDRAIDTSSGQDNQASTVAETGAGNSNSRGGGHGRRADSHHRKDRAMKKHFTGLTSL